MSEISVREPKYSTGTPGAGFLDSSGSDSDLFPWHEHNIYNPSLVVSLI
jgi:hypothetical protein